MPTLDQERIIGGSRVHWFGGTVEARMVETAAIVCENVAKAAANHARMYHEWESKTGETEASIFSTPAKIDGLLVKAFWGAGGASLYLEFGTQFMPARPFLRPAADATYKLARFAGAMSEALGALPKAR